MKENNAIRHLKNKVEKSLKHYLMLNGWPDKISPDDVLNKHLPLMWAKLDREGLVEELKQINVGYGDFINSARKAKIESVLKSEVF